MEKIEISVNKQIDGISFSIAPSIRRQVKTLFPNAFPANNIFVAYDIKSDFEAYIGRLENYIIPAILGVEINSKIQDKIDRILFIDSHTGHVLHTQEMAA